MKKISLILVATLFWGCSVSNSNLNQSAEVEENDKIAVCGEIAGDKQTYPTLGDLHNDGAKFLYYGPCYE